MRTTNLSTILHHLHLSGPTSRSQLVEATGLTRSSVAALVGELVTAQRVTEEAPSTTRSAGRPSPIVATNARFNAVYAIEIAVDSVAVAVVGLGGCVLAKQRKDRSRQTGKSGKAQVSRVMRDITELVEMLDSEASECRVLAVGVAVVGLVPAGSTRVIAAPNLGWVDVDLHDLVLQACGRELPVVVANEGDLAALAETRRGAASGTSNSIFLSGEVGVGGGIFADGRSLHGRAGLAGEIGHIPINPVGTRCGCGAIGCWETEVGERALLQRAGRSADGGRSAVIELLEAAKAGDPATRQALQEHGTWLGLGLAGLINIFDPEIVVLGGLFRESFPYVCDAINDELSSRLVRRLNDVTIVPSALGNEAALLGAAELALATILTDPLAEA